MSLHSSVLRYFDVVARLGSIRKAADRLNVASSAINRQLLNLEDTIGTPIFERLPRGVRLTAAGEILIRHVRNTLREFAVVRSEIDDLRGLRKGTITIVAVEGVATEFLPSLLTEFHEQYPGINFTVHVLSGEHLISNLAANESDIGFMFNPPPSKDVTWGAALKLKIGAIMKPEHPLAKRRSIRLSDCEPYPVILPDITFPNRTWLDAAISQSHATFHPIALSNSFQVMRALAKQGLGITFQTVIGIEANLKSGELVYVPLRDPIIEPSVLVALLRPKQKLSTAAEILLGEIREKFNEMSKSPPSLLANRGRRRHTVNRGASA
jgi:DNA-binding transcriptional LysR family regulator